MDRWRPRRVAQTKAAAPTKARDNGERPASSARTARGRKRRDLALRGGKVADGQREPLATLTWSAGQLLRELREVRGAVLDVFLRAASHSATEAAEPQSYGAAVRAAPRTRLGSASGDTGANPSSRHSEADVGGASNCGTAEVTHTEQTTFRHVSLQKKNHDQTCRVASLIKDDHLRTVTLKALEQVGAEYEPGTATSG